MAIAWALTKLGQLTVVYHSLPKLDSISVYITTRILYHSQKEKQNENPGSLRLKMSQILTHLRWPRRQHGLTAELVEGIICRRTLSNSIFGHKTHLPRFKEIYIYTYIYIIIYPIQSIHLTNREREREPGSQELRAHPRYDPHLMSEHIAVLKIALRHRMPKGQDDEPNGHAAEQEPKLSMNQG